jgi:hypothetical protein
VTHDKEVQFFSSFFNLLYSIKLKQGGEDKLSWSPSKRWMFEVKTLYNALPHNSTHFPCKSICQTNAPSRVAFFAWTATSEKIYTMKNLRKRHIIVANWCCMCEKRKKIVDHLLLHCETDSAIWNSIFGLFGIE